MSDRRGYMLLELVIGAALTCAVSAVLFQFAIAAHAAVAVQGNAADQQQRLRVAVGALRQALLMAGAGPSRGAGRGPLIRVLPPVVPARLGAANPDPELTARDDRISIVYVPETRSQTLLRSAMGAPSSPLAIDGDAPGCMPGTACEFAAGDRVLIYEPSAEGSGHEFFTVAAVDPARALLTPAAPLSRPYAAGARVVVAAIRTYHLDIAGKRLMVYDGDRSDVPLVDHVIGMQVTFIAEPPLGLLTTSQLADGPFMGESPNRFDADLLRVRRVRVTLRLQSEAPARGAGDLETTIDVVPPNLAAR